MIKATIVVQSNNMGIPGLVTAADKIYEVKCNYGSMIGDKQTSSAQLNVQYVHSHAGLGLN